MVEVTTYNQFDKKPTDVTDWAAHLFVTSIFPDKKVTPTLIRNEAESIRGRRLDVVFDPELGRVAACSSSPTSGLRGRGFYVNRLAVEPRLRGHGIGSLVITTLATDILSSGLGIREISLETDGDPDRNRFYQRLGFVLGQGASDTARGFHTASPYDVLVATGPVFPRPPELPRSS